MGDLISKFADDTKIGEVLLVLGIVRGYNRIEVDWRLGHRNGRWNLIRTNERLHILED